MSDKYLTLDCGCQFEIRGKFASGNPKIFVPIKKLPDCQLTWRLLGEGRTKGVFQLESNLGQTWAGRLQPKTLEHMSALGSILRPGCLQAKDENGISMTAHYCRRTNKEEDAIASHPSLSDLLNKTEQIMIYQEQAMAIGAKLAGFDKKNVDRLRKAIGKKNQREMGEVEKLFIEGCKVVGIVDENEAKYIFDQIKESGRYLFNKCLSPNSVVETQNGTFKTINDTEIGEFINSEEGFTQILDKIETGVKELFEITTESGKTLECSIDHKLVCEDGVKRPLWEILEKSYKIVCDQ